MKVQSRFDKNKIGELVCDGAYKYVSNFAVEINGERVAEYNSLEAVARDWKDYEEPKEYWYINSISAVGLHTRTNGMTDSENSYMEDRQLEIGNHFETEEEAKKAVDKLKALTEAKEDGLKIKGYYYNHEDLVILADIGKCNKLTLDTLFGKEID